MHAEKMIYNSDAAPRIYIYIYILGGIKKKERP